MAVSHVSAWQETGKMRFKRAASLEKRIERRKGQGSHDLETVPLTATRLISLSLWLLLATRTPAHTAETSRAEQSSRAMPMVDYDRASVSLHAARRRDVRASEGRSVTAQRKNMVST
jgi:hypothetical protein